MKLFFLSVRFTTLINRRCYQQTERESTRKIYMIEPNMTHFWSDYLVSCGTRKWLHIGVTFEQLILHYYKSASPLHNKEPQFEHEVTRGGVIG